MTRVAPEPAAGPKGGRRLTRFPAAGALPATRKGRVRQGVRVHLVELTPAEIPALRVAMGDVQASVARFYADTARAADLDAAVRSFVANAQVVNDLLTNQATNAADYKALFDQATAPSPAALEVINGVKYARIIASARAPYRAIQR